MPNYASTQLQKESLEVVFNMAAGLSDSELNNLFMLDRKTSKNVFDEIGQLLVAGVPNPSLDSRVAALFKSLVTTLNALQNDEAVITKTFQVLDRCFKANG